MKALNILFLLLIISMNVQGQKQNLNIALRDFLNTPFMVQYQKTQLEMERLTKDFMSEQNQYSTTDIQKVEYAYSQTTLEFNKVLLEIKKDFLDKNTQKILKRAPDLYNSKLELKMQQLKTIYANNFLQTLADVKGEAIDGGPFLLTLTELSHFVFSVVEFMVNIKKQNYKFNDQFLEDRLIKTYTAPSWEELYSKHKSNSPYGTDGTFNPTNGAENNQNNNNYDPTNNGNQGTDNN